MKKLQNITESLKNPKVVKTLLSMGYLFEVNDNSYDQQIEAVAEYDKDMIDEIQKVVNEVEEEITQEELQLKDDSPKVDMTENALEQMIKEAFILGTLKSPFLTNDIKKQIRENFDNFAYYIIDNVEIPSPKLMNENALSSLYEDDDVLYEDGLDGIENDMDFIDNFYAKRNNLNEDKMATGSDFNNRHSSIVPKLVGLAELIKKTQIKKPEVKERLTNLATLIETNKDKDAFNMYRSIRNAGELGKEFTEAFLKGRFSNSLKAKFLTGNPKLDEKIGDLAQILSSKEDAYQTANKDVSNTEYEDEKEKKEVPNIPDIDTFMKQKLGDNPNSTPPNDSYKRDLDRFSINKKQPNDVDKRLNEIEYDEDFIKLVKESNIPAFKPVLGTSLTPNKTEADKQGAEITKQVKASQKTVQGKVEDNKISKMQKYTMNEFEKEVEKQTPGRNGLLDIDLTNGSNPEFDKGIKDGIKGQAYDDEGGVEHTDVGKKMLDAAKERGKDGGIRSLDYSSKGLKLDDKHSYKRSIGGE
jgi:hypothetical protein